jgi:hypothetical protein
MTETEQAYVSQRPCGCVGIVVMERTHETPKMVAAAIRRGEAVERWAVERVRSTPLRCDEHRAPSRLAAYQDAALPGMEDVAAKPAERR